MSERELSSLELVHDFLIDQRVVNIIIDQKPPVMVDTKGTVLSGEDGESRLLLVAPVDLRPPLVIAEIWTRKSLPDEDGRVRLCIRSQLLKMINKQKYQIPGAARPLNPPMNIALNLEDPDSLDEMIKVLEQICVLYNAFAKIMNKIGAGLLAEHLLWDDMNFNPVKLKL